MAALTGQKGRPAEFGFNEQAAEFGDVLLYSARGIPPSAVVQDPAVFTGKLIIDLNNGDIPENFAYQPITISLAEKLQAQLPQSRIVKAFNTISQELFELAPEPLGTHHVSVFAAAADIGFTPPTPAHSATPASSKGSPTSSASP